MKNLFALLSFLALVSGCATIPPEYENQTIYKISGDIVGKGDKINVDCKIDGVYSVAEVSDDYKPEQKVKPKFFSNFGSWDEYTEPAIGKIKLRSENGDMQWIDADSISRKQHIDLDNNKNARLLAKIWSATKIRVYAGNDALDLWTAYEFVVEKP